MRDLARKYRPRRLADVYGQPKAVDTIRQHLASGSNQSLLFVGASGTGKTTTARILGATLQCDIGGSDPCGACPSCEAILGGQSFTFGWYELDGGRHSSKDRMTEIVRLTRGEHVFNWAAFIDEIHALDGAAADSLLKAVEEPGKGSQFFAATTELAAVRPALRKRCLIVPFVPLSAAQGFALLQDISAKEGIRYEPTALDMIASASSGSAREALNMLDQVAWQGDVTTALVAETLSVGVLTPLLAFFDGVVAGDVEAQHRALYEWQAEPAEKARLIRALLLQVYQLDVARPALNHIVDPAFFQLKSDDRTKLVDAIREQAGTTPLPDFWLDLLGAWEFDPAVLTDQASLLIKVHRFHRLLHGVDRGTGTSPLPATQPGTPRQRPFRTRSRKLSPRPEDQPDELVHLNFRQAEAIYDAASMLGQEYGLLFNTSIQIDHGALGEGTQAAAGHLVSALTHELAERMKTWAPGERVHWLYVHEAQAPGIVTELVLYLPPRSLPHVGAWLAQRMSYWRPTRAAIGEGWSTDIPKPPAAQGNDDRRVQRHWKLVRRLWRGLSPNLGHRDGRDGRDTMLKLLGVPRGWHRPIGYLSKLRRYGISGSLAPGKRCVAASGKMKFLSVFADAAWDRLTDGWELREHLDRQREKAIRADQLERIEREWADAASPTEAQRRAEAIRSVEASWPDDPRLRPRSWPGWW